MRDSGLPSPRMYGGFPKAIAQRVPSFNGYASSGPAGESSLDSQAWHACAGPLVCLPRVGDRVVYFPQGHIEQVLSSTNQSAADLQIPQYNLPSQIFCRVLNLSLGAYRETDEVYAQMTLVPENEQTGQSLEFEEPTISPKPKLSMFCKNLTSSDTSTHGGFSVPRRAAEECFAPLDYHQTPPAQELMAKDLHGVEWKFRHIYRGQPRRHLLTTGWSMFVGQKRLVAGDAVLFVRGDNGELRIGIRRAVRPQNSVTSSSLLSSHSMQIGVLAAAAHAVSTKTMFTVFYNPRASPAEFVVPYFKYVKSFKLNMSIGMRFKMRFETEDSSERRYMGTINGIGDIDPTRWPSSKWRCLKVAWDEHAASERQERVSPWEIEPFIAPNVSPPGNMSSKRFRPTIPTDIGVKSSYDNLTSSPLRFQRVLHDLHKSHSVNNNKTLTDKTGLHDWVMRSGDSQDAHQQQLRFCVQQFRERKSKEICARPCNITEPLVMDYATLMKPQTESSIMKLMLPRPTSIKVDVATLKEPKNTEQDCKLFGFSLRSASNSKNVSSLGFMGSTTSESWIRLPGRTCTKVQKKGAVGRAVDMSKFQGYMELLEEIRQLFGIDETLNDSDSGWQAVYIDNEGDMLLIGDDTWEEFCATVRSIRILSRGEVEKMIQLIDQQDSSSSPSMIATTDDLNKT